MKKKRQIKKIQVKILNLVTNWKKIGFVLLVLILSAISLVFIVNLIISYSFKDSKYSYSDLNNIPKRRVAIVFGARVNNNESNLYLEDRVKTAVDLYKNGKIDKIILSGSGDSNNNEIEVMKAVALELEVPEAVLQLDSNSKRTYDTCIRAKEIFKIDEAILVTQNFHMTRALYTCEAVGIDSIGISSNLHEYQNLYLYKLRDKVALMRAIWDTKVNSPDDVSLGDTLKL